jgi:hypothetical protein
MRLSYCGLGYTKGLAEKIQKKLDGVELAAEEESRVDKCVVCGEPASPKSKENLCWICRRLKISAWSDSDNQAPMQE